MKLLNFNIIKLFCCLVLGIITYHFTNIYISHAFYFLISTSLILLVYWVIKKNQIDKTYIFGSLSYLCFYGIGIFSYALNDEANWPSHYTNTSEIHQNQHLQIKIEERLKPDSFNTKYIGTVTSANGFKCEGKILINIKKDTSFAGLKVDDLLFTIAKFQNIQKPLNPHQFDYSSYLRLQQVYHQLYLSPEELRVLSTTKTTLYGLADALRAKINTRLVSSGFNSESLAIINALLLGQRQDIDKTTYNNYVNSGTIHILAVSGLHVGIILIILNFILKPLLLLKYGNVLRPIIILILLWAFAIVAGLSPSVTRAVTMFSIISIAMHYKRPTNIYNTLAISAFLILLFKPIFIFQVGFQMSYLAVLGIVSIQPILYKLFQPKYWVIDKIWQILTVTIAAQLGVVPISLFYFHQFPGLFFVSNLVIIPFLGLILGLGLVVIILALITILPSSIVTIYSYIIETLNDFVSFIAQFEDFLIRDIPFSIIQVALSYLIILAAVQFYRKKEYKWIMVCFIGIIGMQLFSLFNHSNSGKAFIAFNKSRHTIIGQHSKDRLIVSHNLDSIIIDTDNTIKNYKIGESVNFLSREPLQNVYRFNNKTILVIDSIGVYENISFKPDYVLLRDSPKINLNRLVDRLSPITVIADASNYKSYLARWESTCKTKNVPFHTTQQNGAFVLKP